jgi:hypothetical protein
MRQMLVSSLDSICLDADKYILPDTNYASLQQSDPACFWPSIPRFAAYKAGVLHRN